MTTAFSKDSFDIQSRTMRALEWERLKEFLAAQAESRPAKDLCMQLALFEELSEIERLLDETHESVSLLSMRSGLSAASLPELDDTLARIALGASVDLQGLVDLRTALQIARQFKSSLSLLQPDAFPRLTVYVKELPPLDHVLAAIDGVLDEVGNVKEDASSTLRQLFREVRRIDASIKETLHKIIHSSTLSKCLVEPLYTQRNGRYVLPVNASMRGAIAGIVHDSSSSGLTVYVEPIAVLELSNNLRIKESEIEREVAFLLAELSRLAHEHIQEIRGAFMTVVGLDVIMARAKLALKYKGIRPDLSATGHFALKQARHPLLVLQNPMLEAVPNDIELGQRNARTLVITGPNTGGKTVLLKTIGILSLMVRSGLLLPAQSGSVAAVFKNVFADIGDEQSIEQSLSTFSSHMTNIVDIIRQSGDSTLVLLDEVGAGTDPREGAPLARAILEHLHSKAAVTIATTHFGELKTLAYTEVGFVNGSLDFDEATLSPTYRLRLGVPGSSKATTIAKRLGLNASVVDRAHELIENADRDLQQTIDTLEEKLLSASKQEESASRALSEAQELKASADMRMSELEHDTRVMKEKHAAEFESEVRLAIDYVKHLIADLQRQPAMLKAQQTQRDLEKIRKELGLADAPRVVEPEAVLISPGQMVRVRSLNQRGIVTATPPDAHANPQAPYTVQSGTLKIKAPLSDLELIQQPKEPAGGKKKKGTVAVHKGRSAPFSTGKTDRAQALDVFVKTQANTLDLRGQRVDAALDNLERFLDAAQVTSVSPIMIIHGHGTGAIKSAVRDYLMQSPYAESYRPGEMYEGGDGVTIVSL